MKHPHRALATVLCALAAATTHATPLIVTDVIGGGIFDPSFTSLPGQANASAIVLVGNGTITGSPGTSCLVFPDPGFRCDLPAQPMMISADLSGDGIIATGTAQGGNDFAGTTLSVSSSGSAIPAFNFIQFNMIGTDRQRITFEASGGNLPEFLEIDMNFSVFSELIDRSAIATDAPYLPQTSSSIRLLEASTVTDASSFTAFSGETFLNIPGLSDGADLSITLMLRPNVEYWLLLESQSVVSLTTPPGAGFNDTRDYAGLDLEMRSWADPTFALSEAFAAENPDIAANLSINRIGVVPVPAALPLFLSALAGLLAWRRTRH